jgi:hypothetical protein
VSGFAVAFEVDRRELAKTLANLEMLPKRRLRPAVRIAVDAASKEVLKVARATAPRKTGALKRGLIVQRVKMRQGERGVIASKVGVRNEKNERGDNPIKYAHLVERGTKPHIILPRYAKVLHWNGKRQVSYIKKVKVLGGKLAVEKTRNKRYEQFAAGVRHPGIRARRFMLNASQRAFPSAVAAFIAAVQSSYMKEVVFPRSNAA